MEPKFLPLKISKELKTGLLAVVAIVIIIFGFNYLKGKNYFENKNVFHVVYENVEGLVESAPVTINGHQVGKVRKISFADEKGKLLVSFTVEKDFKFGKNSIVQIYSGGLISGNNLGILVEEEPSVMAKPGDTLIGEIQQSILDQVTGQLAPLEAKVQSTLTSLDTLLMGMNQVLDTQSKKNLKNAIANLNGTIYEFRGASRSINQLLEENKDKLGNTISNLDTTTENFARLSDSLAQIETGRLAEDLQGVVNKLNGIAEQIENGEGSIGKLLKDEELYDNLSGASFQLEKLLEDMKLNPKRYVHFSLFGKRQKQYEVPEESQD